MILASLLAILLSTFNELPSTVDAGTVIKKIDYAVQDREARLMGYSSTEKYEVFSLNDDRARTTRTYEVHYQKGKGKTYSPPIAESDGSWRDTYAINRIVEGEEELSKPDAREAILVTSRNYHMKLIDQADAQKPNLICKGASRDLSNTLVFSISAKHPSVNSLEGRIWVDSTNYRLVRIEGQFSKSRFGIGRAKLERDYLRDVNGFAVASSACSVPQGIVHDDVVRVTTTYSTIQK